LSSGGKKRTRTRRDYRPTVEGLEALRLPSGLAEMQPLAALAALRDLLVDFAQQALPPVELAPGAAVSSTTWDAALDMTPVADLLSNSSASIASSSAPTASADLSPADSPVDTTAMASGLSQLNKYLSRAWYRAGIPTQLHDDSSQSVYAALLQSMGRQRFDNLVSDVGHSGIRQVFSRESSEGLAFFRAVDMVKKRAQRERVHQSLDAFDMPARTSDEGLAASRRAALQEAIDQTLTPREAALIQSTLMGRTPAEIALQLGVAPKTVSNEKTRILQKLRDVLAAHELN
jgi:RNA polymerase sigma factor (sigma-70 family)